jgi:hypothetical protein
MMVMMPEYGELWMVNSEKGLTASLAGHREEGGELRRRRVRML